VILCLFKLEFCDFSNSQVIVIRSIGDVFFRGSTFISFFVPEDSIFMRHILENARDFCIRLCIRWECLLPLHHQPVHKLAQF
jgi:hypothetical protein